MALILKGRPVAQAICGEIEKKLPLLKARGIVPALEIIRVGSDMGSEAYERSVMKRFEALGLGVRRMQLPESCSQEKLEGLIKRVNADASIHGLLLLRPLPRGLDERRILSLIDPEKDMDCISMQALSAVFCGCEDCIAPCTAESCMKILDYYNIPVAGRHAAVIGRSLVVGRPLSLMLQKRDATVTMCHSKTQGMAELCRGADIIVAAAGKAGIVDKSFVRPGQTVIDVGINTGNDGKICGDVDYEAVEPQVAAISPVPGGVGSVTTAVLAEHLVEAAEKRLK